MQIVSRHAIKNDRYKSNRQRQRSESVRTERSNARSYMHTNAILFSALTREPIRSDSDGSINLHERHESWQYATSLIDVPDNDLSINMSLLFSYVTFHYFYISDLES